MPETLIKNWTDTIREDLKETGVSWEEAHKHCIKREDWPTQPSIPPGVGK